MSRTGILLTSDLMYNCAMRIALATAFLVAFLSCTALAQPQAEVALKVSEHIIGLDGLTNVGRVAPGIYRGAQPQPAGYESLKKLGIKTIINLRENHDETEVVQTHGMTAISIKMDMLKSISPEAVERAVSAMSDPSLQPVYVHCALGQDRTGTVVAAYRISRQGWTYDEAMQEMQAFGFNDIWVHLKSFLKDYTMQRAK